jgi:hypothetical protein
MDKGFLLPSYKDSLCTSITICCDTNKANVPELLNEEEYVAKYRIPGSYAFLHLAPFKGSNGHIHIDCASYAHFRDSKPTVNAHKEDIFLVLERVKAIDVSASVSAIFRVPFDDISDTSIIAGLSKTQKSKDISLKMVGSKFHIQGSSLCSIEWNLYDNYRMVRTVIKTHMKINISDNFIINAFSGMENLFKQLLLGRSSTHQNSE